jgi:hypothetical protein
MRWVVFSGPTISPCEVEQETRGAAVARGPAGCGDVLRAQEEGCEAILIIDGYFEHRLAVWHKELLWALARGVRVYGSASLGALRAVELEPFGMVGIGRVFELFRDGMLEDDDEVTIIHQAAERGYQAISDAMVNIRATFDRAVADGKVAPVHAAALIAIAKAQFYPSRNLHSLVNYGAAQGYLADPEGFRRWVEANRVDQKRLDALAALERLGSDLAAPTSGALVPKFHFEYTEAWHELMRRYRNQVS